jgi:hypothetical protein
MVADVFQEIADAVMFVSSFEGSSGIKSAKAAIQKGVNKIGKAGIKSALSTAKRALVGKFKDITIGKAIDSVKKTLIEKGKEIFGDQLKNFAVETYCKTVYASATQKLESTLDVSEDILIGAVDIFNVSGIAKSCQNISSESNAIECAKNVLQGESGLDPRGILTVAAAFMHPVCDVPTVGYKPPADDTQIEQAVKQLETVGDNCIILYEGCNYSGKSKKYCSDTNFFFDFNDIASSLRSGKNVSGALFEHPNYQGRSLPFGPSTVIPCFNDYKSQDFNLNDLTSSVKFGADKCVILNYRRTSEKRADSSFNIHICANTPKISISIPKNLEHLKAIIYREKVSAILYEGENYTGRSWQISERGNIDTTKVPFYNIKSINYVA